MGLFTNQEQLTVSKPIQQYMTSLDIPNIWTHVTYDNLCYIALIKHKEYQIRTISHDIKGSML